MHTYIESSLEAEIERYSKEGRLYNLIGILVNYDNDKDVVERIYDELYKRDDIFTLYKIYKFSKVPIGKGRFYGVLEKIAEKGKGWEIKEWVELATKLDPEYRLNKEEIDNIYKSVMHSQGIINLHSMIDTIGFPSQKVMDEFLEWMLEIGDTINISYLILNRDVIPSKEFTKRLYLYLVTNDSMLITYIYKKTGIDIDKEVTNKLYKSASLDTRKWHSIGKLVLMGVRFKEDSLEFKKELKDKLKTLELEELIDEISKKRKDYFKGL